MGVIKVGTILGLITAIIKSLGHCVAVALWLYVLPFSYEPVVKTKKSHFTVEDVESVGETGSTTTGPLALLFEKHEKLRKQRLEDLANGL
jgi:hypothetical protein